MAALNGAFGQAFEEAVDFFRQKEVKGTTRWDDIWQSAHDRSFVVAGAMKTDLLHDLQAAVAPLERQGLETFRKNFQAIVEKHGWHGWTGEGSAKGEAWRTRVIFETNVSTAYAAGRWRQLNDPDLLKLRPYWKYVHDEGVKHPRPLHKQWGDMALTLPHDHPFWQTNFPPNGWFCHCRVIAVRRPADGAATEPPEGWNLLDDKTGAPPGIDRGWGYAPGASLTGDIAQQKIDSVSPALGAAFKNALTGNGTLKSMVFVAQPTAKQAAEWAVRNNLADAADYTGITTEVANAWNRSMWEHCRDFPELRKNQQFIGTTQALYQLDYERRLEEEAVKLAAILDIPHDEAIAAAKNFVTLKKVPEGAYALSFSGGKSGNGITVNAIYGNAPDRFLRDVSNDVASKWHPVGTGNIKAIADHELGHQLDALLGLQADADVVKLYNETMKQGVGDQVSLFAGENINEFIAECWAEFRSNPSPRPAARSLGEILEQRYRSSYLRK
ncbi:hypothetical protein AGMMS49960_06810 [Betaproteobacteria bacterium]|nr:hypothetical protein AGMMS49960_06810 [Betaproteobacteria bacterium]